jgi:hypothetical protein
VIHEENIKGRQPDIEIRLRRAAMLIGMADFLVVVAIVAFAAAMLGLIWALDRV